MQERLLKALLKAKTTKEKSVDELIDDFLSAGGKAVRERTEAFASELLVFLMKNTSVGKDELLKITEAKLSALSYDIPSGGLDEIYFKTAEAATVAAAANPKATLVFGQRDAAAIEALHKNFAWIGQDASAATQEKIKSAVQEAFEGKLPAAELGAALRERFGGIGDEAERHYQGVGDHMIRQSQSLARMSQFEKYRVPYGQIVAIVDGKTSPVCRSLNGRIIPMSHLVEQADNLLAAQSIAQKKAAAAWPKGPVFGALPSNVGLPPFHLHCRTEVVAFFGYETDIDGKKATGSYLPGEKFGKNKTTLFSHVDKTGVERVVTEATYTHPSKSIKPPPKDMIAAMNSIQRISEHAHEPGRFVALTQKNIVLIYEGQEVVTAIQRESAKDALRYYRQSAIESKKEVFKWSKDAWLLKLQGIFAFTTEP